MIDTFTKNLPPQLAVQIQGQYNDLLPIFRAYTDSKNSVHYSEIGDNYDISCFILGLALFYKAVVIPLREANSSFKDLQNQEGIRGVQIGKYIFANADGRQIQVMYSELLDILAKYLIPEYLLLFSDVKEFGRNLNSYFKNRHD